jgi:hypothetical protein
MSTKPTEHPETDKILLLMVSGISAADLTAACTEKLGIPPEEVAGIIAQARRKLTLAADYNRDEQIGTAFTRLNDLYARAIRAQDIKTGLIAQKELNKLLDLYRVTPEHAAESTGDDAGPDRSELAAIRGHLIPLGLAAADYPLREHARIAAELVRDHPSQKKG